MEHHPHSHSSEKRISFAFFLNLAFTIIEIIGGIYTNSLAILSDALHDLGDSLSLGLSWYFQHLSAKGRTKNYSYGYRRFSILGATINAIILIVGSIVILSQAIPALFNPRQVNSGGMLLLSILGIAFNGIAFYRMSFNEGLNEKMVKWHLLEDLLGWIAVLVGSLLILWFDWLIIDPLLSILISLFIVYNVIKNLKSGLSIFLQATPEGLKEQDIHKRLTSIDEILSLHDCHAWSLDGSFNVLTVHLVVRQNMDLTHQAKLKSLVRETLSDLPLHHITIEFEGKDEKCELEDC